MTPEQREAAILNSMEYCKRVQCSQCGIKTIDGCCVFDFESLSDDELQKAVCLINGMTPTEDAEARHEKVDDGHSRTYSADTGVERLFPYVAFGLMMFGIASEDLKEALQYTGDNKTFCNALQVVLNFAEITDKTAEGIISNITLRIPEEDRNGYSHYIIERVIEHLDVVDVIDTLEQEETDGDITVTISTADGIMIHSLLNKMANVEGEMSKKTLPNTAREHKKNSKRLSELAQQFLKL